ncbi:2-dehydro-3-deoxygluconokinase/2-dehydro-3-deoxygalactonokinase [Candidatus Lokiarchaeum ossiferum]|uniref:2-dehydro-3-deoxygluconokinase/2-dehydro-3-deoxygalactonokinase n=1 Tax=Candidatus Lokiarchaeum ossiferum TaxID=2951803 RepID=A0ABY6HTT6_9ARCH|nr:2-dehydro-3-deoxygluconokinase/2-dehydro-3-deoxygalactonokinase [Candidatus Lokiarchaeum sp. B-35]
MGQNYIVTLGEIMLRLKSPGHEKLLQSPSLEATFGGGESNVAVSLANYDLNARYVTALPVNSIGDSCVQFLRSMNVDTSCIIRQGDRIGVYFLEIGSGPRPSKVIYDRSHSAISEAGIADFDWDGIFKNAKWFHITGITPALSQKNADLSIFAVKKAKEKGLTVSCDLNFRKKLWKYGKSAPEVMAQLMPYIDVVIANEEDIQKSLGMSIDQKIGGSKLSAEKYENLARHLLTSYSNVQTVAITLRESYSADHNGWAAIGLSRGDSHAVFSKKYDLKDIVDRVGGGDSFGGALIYGLFSKKPLQDALEFAVAASALKHTIPGDINRVSIAEVTALMQGDSSGRVQR